MHHRTTKVAFAAVLVLVFVLMLSGSAFAQWPDLTLSILGDYGVTEAEVAAISDGYTDGTWKPYTQMPRKQFVKMAVDAYKIPLVDPATPTYTDVPPTHDYYMYVEAATAAGLTNGVGGGLFDPEGMITREQAAAIISRWVAEQNGYDLDTMYTAAEIDALLGSYPDGDQVGPSLQEEMAFAVDFGIVWGDATGMLAPKKNLTRIQGAAMLIRSWSIIPEMVPPLPPADIELVSDDEAENLIGLTHQYTYMVTDENGDPVEGALVDFDTLMAQWYVGNVQPEAGLTDADGMVTVNLISTEPGIQRVSAAAPGLLAMWSTKYWVALDEVYVLDESHYSRNNAGTSHTWEARVLVFGPGPLSTSVSDWYNVYDPEADPTDVDVEDAVDWNGDGWCYDEELAYTAEGYMGRSLPDIPVYWELDEGSVGEIVSAEFNAEPIAADGMSVWAYTDADGLTSVELYSEEAGTAYVTVMADYVGNPYEGQLFNHSTFNYDDWDHYYEWDDQPAPCAYAEKEWIPHVIGGDEGPIDPAYTYANIGEEFILTITLEDVFGNPIEGKQVEWFMQGIGHFVTDDENTVTDPTDPAGNRDIDVTDAAGTARVFVKSLDAGEQIVHAKVRDKGIDGMEGQFITYDAEVQWFDVDVVTFDDPTTLFDHEEPTTNEAWSSNTVGTEHTFTLNVWGLKLELDPSVDNPAQQTPYIDTDYAGSSYDGVFDWKDAAYMGGVLLVNSAENGSDAKSLALDMGKWPYDIDGNGMIDPGTDEEGTVVLNIQGQDLVISGAGGYTKFDWDMDGFQEWFDGQTGIYLPLEGKDVTFDLVDNYIGYHFDEDGLVESVGSFSPETAVTDENGQATVTVTSTTKGPQTVEATVDWEHNPHNLSELLQAYAKKIWVAGEGVDIVVSIEGEEVANNSDGEVGISINPVWVDPDANTPLEAINGNPDDANFGMALNRAHIEVHVYDEFGNDLPDYEVVYLLENLGTTLEGKQGAEDTYLPKAYFFDADETNTIDTWNYDRNGPRPDHDEPAPEDDPYAPIVGDGGTWAFYFNQWLGAGYGDNFKQKNRPEGIGFYTYQDVNLTTFTQPGYVKIPPKTGSVKFESYMDVNGVGLLTDGAKAWTMDGYFRTGFREQFGVWPNLLTGSHVDVQLAEDPTAVSDAGHAKSIVKILVYPPSDGLVVDQAPIWEYQVHKVWEIPVVSEITLEPAADAAIAGLESQTVTATVLDQFGNPMEGVTVYFYSDTEEGSLTNQAGGASFVTNNEGKANFSWSQAAGDWGVQSVWASADSVMSNDSFIQWIYQDGTGALGDLVEALDGQTKVTAFLGTVPWDNQVLSVFDAPGNAALGSATYNQLQDLTISTLTKVWSGGERFFVGALGSANDDEIPNWVTDVVAAP